MNTPIIESLELVAERAGDITAPTIAAYHERCPASAALMDHMDEHMLGRMMDQVLLLIMEDGEAELNNYLEFETANHEAYGVEPHMYDNLFSAVVDTVKSVLGSSWTERFDAAWRARSESLLAAIHHAAAELHAAEAGSE